MQQDSWQVRYPEGLVRYIDYFRQKYFQYEVFDEVLHSYVSEHLNTSGNRLCSLGVGTGRHEVELTKMGFEITGIERNRESLAIAREHISNSGVKVNLLECDFLNQDDLKRQLQGYALFDVVALLFVPISIKDRQKTVMNMAKYLAPGGIFVTGLFGYSQNVDTKRLKIVSDVEVADSPDKSDYAVRLNYYEYHNNIVNWDAIYLVHDEDGNLRMVRDHDILTVNPEQDGVDPFDLDPEMFDLLPSYRITETHETINPPLLCNYFIGWRKK